MKLETSWVLIAFNKPYTVLSQFSRESSSRKTLADFGFPKNVYPIGRLDSDSEGLLLLSDELEWNERLLHPRHAHKREYWAQVERIPTPEALKKLERGILVQGRKTLPCCAWILEPQPEVAATPPSHITNAPTSSFGDEASPLQIPPPDRPALESAREDARPTIWPRIPPIRFRKNVPDCWIGLKLVEGKNRQVRRMTAAIGHPTLRLIRIRIGNFWLGDLQPGRWWVLTAKGKKMVVQSGTGLRPVE